MINKLNALKRRYEELTAALSAPDAMNDQAAWREMVKEHSQLEEIVNAFDEYTAAVQSEADCKAMLEEADDERRLRRAGPARCGQQRPVEERVADHCRR